MQIEAIARDHVSDQLSHAVPQRRIPPRELEPLLAAIPDAVFRITSNGMIEDVNQLGEALVGFTRAELIGRAIQLAVVHLEPMDGVDSTIAHRRRVEGSVARHRIFAHVGAPRFVRSRA
ncbi:MAG: PAS domain-containing protein [Deltaproteobacteria bacterium]